MEVVTTVDMAVTTEEEAMVEMVEMVRIFPDSICLGDIDSLL
jgi:hypothetical protein